MAHFILRKGHILNLSEVYPGLARPVGLLVAFQMHIAGSKLLDFYFKKPICSSFSVFENI